MPVNLGFRDSYVKCRVSTVNAGQPAPVLLSWPEMSEENRENESQGAADDSTAPIGDSPSTGPRSADEYQRVVATATVLMAVFTGLLFIANVVFLVLQSEHCP